MRTGDEINTLTQSGDEDEDEDGDGDRYTLNSELCDLSVTRKRSFSELSGGEMNQIMIHQRKHLNMSIGQGQSTLLTRTVDGLPNMGLVSNFFTLNVILCLNFVQSN